jgi:hypothetical protein
MIIFAELLARTVAADSIRSYVAGVRSLHVVRTGRVPWEFGAPALRLARVLRGIAKRQAKPKQKRAPVTVSLLEFWRTFFDLSKPRHAMLWAALLLGFYALLRKSEFAVPDRVEFNPDRHLTRQDVQFIRSSSGSHVVGVDVHIKFSKTAQFGDTGTVPVAANGGITCPVAALLRMFALAPAPPSAPLFREIDGSPLRSSTVVQLLRRLVLATPSLARVRLTPHSLRIGGTLALQEAGASEAILQVVGRWRSTAWRAYLRFSRASALSWSRRMASPRQASRPRSEALA